MEYKSNKIRIKLHTDWQYLNIFKEMPIRFFTLIQIDIEVNSCTKYLEIYLGLLGVKFEFDFYKKWLWKDE